ncbi:YbaY family lipoprotein [Tropicimonas sediminicola]|uniref:Putative lipoprotein n=1 Tax=Tropicimonas sediminicola TaxID=1031541 RepID=A0A239CUQ3_9RHOB|nr:YbaY family lipoprotein [Tropicimonas sediminicola]SNS23381.1 putative lipoprotein [Tropicimonas sediminicola]
MRSFLLALMALIGAPAPGIAETLTGTVTYLQRIMLPPSAEVVISFQDVSRADAPAEVLATYRIPEPGAPPYRFAFAYDPARIDPAHSYTVMARVIEGDRLLMITDTAYPVLTRGGGTDVEMILKMANDTPPPKPDVDFVNTYWKILTLGDTPIEVQDNAREPHVILRTDGSYNATVGCNMIRGGYELNGPSVRFLPGAATMMACPPPLDALERSLGEMLEAASEHRVSGEQMELVGPEGETLATFRAVDF